MIVSILSNTRICIALVEVISWAFPVDPIEQFDLFKIKTFMLAANSNNLIYTIE